jgi:transcription initiation factor IIE alpha subunit
MSGYDFQTSYPAYQEAQKNLGEKQLAVYKTILSQRVCNDRQIAEELRWPINRVTPRRNELVEAGYVIPAGLQLDRETGRKVNYWKIKQAQTSQVLTMF